ncbi:Photosystem I assembly protein Ycf3 [uncultured archaeon]|nr:Photosystem I assembly protein Ycf3 [uncultured archaeon]
MTFWFFWLCLIALCGSGLASDVPFVFIEDSSDLASYSSDQLQKASSSSPDLVGVPPVISPSDSEILEIPVTGGGSTSEGKLEKEAGDLKEELNKKVEPDYTTIRETAAMLASKYPGDLRIDQICEIYYYLKYGDDTKSGWRYVRDTRGIDSWNYANASMKIGDRIKCVGLGDCDDFAILMAAFVESIGGATRIILANNNSIGGHAYTEVYLGQLNNSNCQIKDIMEWLQREFNAGKIYGHVDTDTKEVWLNLDWGPDERGNAHPGGPLFQGDKHYVLRIRERYKIIPLKMAEASDKPPKLISLTPDKNSPQEAGSIVTWTARAIDPENDQIFYQFFLNNDPISKWLKDNAWTWKTTDYDIGENQIDVWVRDGKHAGPNGFDSSKKFSSFTITETEPNPAVLENQPPVAVSMASDKPSPQDSGDTPVTIQSNGIRGYQVYLDEVLIGNDGTTRTSLDGEFSFFVSGNQNHNVRICDGQFNYSKNIYFQKGVQKIINVEPDTASYPIPVETIAGDTPVTIRSQGIRGYQVYLDGVLIGTDGTGRDPLDGEFSFFVSGNQNHNVRVYDGQFNYPKNIYFQKGVPKIINVEPMLIPEDKEKSEKINANAIEWYNKGLALYDQSQYDEALKAYDEAIRLDPNYAPAWNNKGLTLGNLGKYDEAIEAYDEAIRLDTKPAAAWNNKGNALDAIGSY